jgi:hypothetical protein
MSARFVAGGWVEISRSGLDDIYTNCGLFLEKGPHQIHSVNLAQGFLSIEKAGLLLAIQLQDCIIVDAPRLTAAQKERAAMDAEPWRRYRDQNLTDVFKPKEKERPTPAAPKVNKKPESYFQFDSGNIPAGYAAVTRYGPDGAPYVMIIKDEP